MVEKRKRYMALRESTSAKRRSPSPTRATETPEVPVRSLTPDVPTTFSKDGPLPVLPGRQATNLLLKDYKSVAESKVMLESLERSRRKWVDGDIFEKFWTKPLKSRKLDPAELERNPSKDCMARLGNATLSCKPHKFEIKLFGVLEPVKAPLASPTPPQPPQIQLPPPTTPMAMAPRPQYTMDTPQQQNIPHPGTATQPVNSYVPPVQSAPTLAQAPVVPQASTPGPPVNVPAITFHVPTPIPGHHPQDFHPQQQQHPHPYPHPQQQHPQHPHPQHPGNTNMQPGPLPRPDPVIQSLAVRAASDPDLKALMRIVASGKATAEQLRIFQGHIDALTPASCPPIVPTVGRARPLAPAQGSVGAQAQARPQPTQQLHPQHLQLPQHLQHQQMNHHPQYVQHPQYSQQQPQMQTHHPVQFPQQSVQAPPKPKPFPQPPKQEITSVVFEFTDQFSQGDRFIFPKYTILEYAKNGTMVTASFMITRKPIDDLDEYYQPVTTILESINPRTLEVLQKVVADQETTCNHMKHLMSTLKRADDSFLVFRLRRDPNEVAPDKQEVIEALPPRAARESRVRRETSTPVRDSKGTPGDTAQLPSSRPRVKTVKKALPKEPPQAAVTTSNINHTYPTSAASASALPPTTPRIPHPKPPKPPKPPRSRKGRIADPTKSCSICKTSKTSLWRKADIEGENVTVCNACGIKWKTNAQRAAQVAAAAATGQPLPPSRESSMSGGQRPTLQQLTSGEPIIQFHPFPQGVYPQEPFPQQQFNGFQTGPSTTQEMLQDEATTVIVRSAPVVDSATSSIVASHVAAHSAQPPQVQGDSGDGTVLT